MAFEDGKRLFRFVQEIGLEGVVAKKLSRRYRPGERLWVKVENRDYRRYPLELEAARMVGDRTKPPQDAPGCSRRGNASRALPMVAPVRRASELR